jgi:phosphoribosylformimino-5-aminoimidazole carboxamide ribotide isomerase
VAVEGWTEVTSRDPLDLGREYEEWGVRAIIYTDIRRDGTQKGPAQRSTRRLAKGLQVPLIAAGGIATLEDVQKMARLEKQGVVGLITGKAIYSGSLNLPEAIRWLRNNSASGPLLSD